MVKSVENVVRAPTLLISVSQIAQGNNHDEEKLGRIRDVEV